MKCSECGKHFEPTRYCGRKCSTKAATITWRKAHPDRVKELNRKHSKTYRENLRSRRSDTGKK